MGFIPIFGVRSSESMVSFPPGSGRWAGDIRLGYRRILRHPGVVPAGAPLLAAKGHFLRDAGPSCGNNYPYIHVRAAALTRLVKIQISPPNRLPKSGVS